MPVSAPLPETTLTAAPVRRAKPHTYLMCRPDYFTVTYKINPWMDPAIPTDTSLALRQWKIGRAHV